MRTHVVRARADIVATKLGFLLLSFHIPPNLRVAKGPERSGGTQPSDDFFLVGSGRRIVCALGK